MGVRGFGFCVHRGAPQFHPRHANVWTFTTAHGTYIASVRLSGWFSRYLVGALVQAIEISIPFENALSPRTCGSRGSVVECASPLALWLVSPPTPKRRRRCALTAHSTTW